MRDYCAVPGFSGRDVGLLVYDSGSGSWSLYMDGVGVGLDGGNDEELSASWIDGSGHMYLSVRSSYTVPGLGGDSFDILACAPRIPLRSGAVPSLSSRDGAQNGFNGEWINAMFIAG